MDGRTKAASTASGLDRPWWAVPATRLDDWMGVTEGWGLTLSIAGTCVFLQLALVLLQILCPLCVRTMFEWLSL